MRHPGADPGSLWPPIIWADEERIKKDPQKTNEMMANRRCNFRNGKVLRSFSIWQGVNGSNAACSLTLWQNMLMAWKCMQNKIAYIVKNETQNQVWYPCRSPILSTFCGNAIFFYVRSRLSNLFYCHVRERDCGRLRAENIASHCPKLRLFNGNAVFVVVKGHSRYVVVRLTTV